MVGRRRRCSTSSAEGASRRTVHWCQESSVLRGPEPGTSDNDWPIFELKDAVVLGKDGETVENALEVLFKGPFIVRGTMVVDDAEQKRHLIMRVRSSVAIEIPACSRYSMGEAEEDNTDGSYTRTSRSPVLWMGGRGAWFEINPSKAYLPTYRAICEAISLYYAIYDIYDLKTPKAVNRMSKSADPIERLSEVFLQYSIKAGNGLTVEEVAQKCRDLAPFFISQFLESKSNERFWEETFFYRWIIKEHEDLFKQAKQAMRNPSKPSTPSLVRGLPSRSKRGTSDINGSASESQELATKKRSTRSTSTGSGAQDSTAKSAGVDESTASQHRATRSRSALQHEIQVEPTEAPAAANNRDQDAHPTFESDDTAFESVLKSLSWAHDRLSKTKRGITKSGLLNDLYFGYKWPSFKKNGQSGSHKIPVQEVLHYNAPALMKALDPSKWGGTDFYPWLEEMSKTKFEPEAFKKSSFPYDMVPRSSRPQQSRGTNAASAQPAPVVVGGPSRYGEDDDTHPGPFETPKRAGKGVKTPGRLGKSSLRPVASSKKRPRSDVDSDSDSDSRDAKRSHYFPDADDDMGDSDTSVPGIKDEDEEKVKIALRADKIPSTVPRGPHETWTCDQEDCDYIVRGGDAEECQELIRQHFEDHEHRTERVQLAMTESRGHLPINHLLDKIKQLGDKTDLEEELSVGGVAAPRPIRGKLIV